jgi:hypothetical protein
MAPRPLPAGICGYSIVKYLSGRGVYVDHASTKLNFISSLTLEVDQPGLLKE